MCKNKARFCVTKHRVQFAWIMWFLSLATVKHRGFRLRRLFVYCQGRCASSAWITRLCPCGNAWNMLLTPLSSQSDVATSPASFFPALSVLCSSGLLWEFPSTALKSQSHTQSHDTKSCNLWRRIKVAVLTARLSQHDTLVALNF